MEAGGEGVTRPTTPCPKCGHGAYHRSTGLLVHLIRHHSDLDDRERSDAVHEWMAQGGRR